MSHQVPGTNNAETPMRKTRIALVSYMKLSIVTAAKVIRDRPDTELALVITATGPKTRRTEAYMSVIQALWDEDYRNVDVVVSNKRSKYADLCALCNVDLVMCIGFPWLLPASLLSDPRIALGAVNFHNSNLPELRGPNACGRAIMNGDTTFHFVCHRMSPEFDTGPILVRGKSKLGINENFEGVYWPPALMMDMVNQAIDLAQAGEPGQEQQGEPTYAGSFEPAFRYMNFSDGALYNHNKVRAHYHPKGALAHIDDGSVICITKTRVDLDENHEYNKKAENTPDIVTAVDGSVNLPRKQILNKNSFDTRCGDGGTLHVLEWNFVIDNDSNVEKMSFPANNSREKNTPRLRKVVAQEA